MSKIKIECTAEQANQIIEMINMGNDCSCSVCPLAYECSTYIRWHEGCSDVWKNEIDWIIKN